MKGEIVSHYKIIKKIGGGGMGVVYLAEDTQLNRKVALKFLPPDLTRDPEARIRLVHEAQAASALDHPTICTVYEIDQTRDGHMFIAMAFYVGCTLREKIGKGHIGYEEALYIGVEIASGLAKVHEKGIIHRDIKPANIIITSDKRIKIVDFGLAILSGQTRLTLKGQMTIGTVNYMSPEQARGRTIDHRTDIWSLGVVLYEMVTGKHPFRGANAQSVIHSLLNDVPDPIMNMTKKIPKGFECIINRCLEKDPENRFLSMDDVKESLQRLQQCDPGDLLIAQEIVYEKKPSIAVLPFSNLSENREQDYFCDGVTDEIIHVLGHVDGLRVLARGSVFSLKDNNLGAREIGNRLKVEHVLHGRVRSSDNRLRIFVELISVTNGYTIWSERYDRKMEDIFAIQDEISLAIVETLKVKLLGKERNLIGKRPTGDIEAYHLYLQGNYFLNKRTTAGLEKAMRFFNQAVEKDPSYALAYVGISDTYTLLAGYEVILSIDAYKLARKAVLCALKKDNSLALGHSTLAILLWEDSVKQQSAEQEFRKAIDLAPGLALLHHAYAEFLAALGRYEQALVETRLAIELDPLSLISHVLRGFIYYLMRHYDQAIKHYYSVIEMDPNFIPAQCELGMTLIQHRKYDEGIETLKKATELSNNSPMYLSRLAYAYGVSGDRKRAREYLCQLEQLSKNTYVSAFSLAIIFLGLNDKEQAISFFDKAFEEKHYHILMLKTEPLFDSIRSDPRMQKLLEKMGFSTH